MRAHRRKVLAVSAAVLLLLAGAASAIAANAALLGYAGRHNDPVGNLSPRTVAAAPGRQKATPLPRPAPSHSDAADD